MLNIRKAASQQTLLHIVNIILGVMMAFLFINHALNGITYSNAGVVAQDLGMTLNIMQSVPTPTQVQYQPDTANYVISLSQEAVSVQGSEGSGRHPIYRPTDGAIRPGKALYEPTVTLISNQDTVGFKEQGNNLATFCEAIAVKRTSAKIHVASTAKEQSLVDDMKKYLDQSDNIDILDEPASNAITLLLQPEQNDALKTTYKDTADTVFTTEVACRLTANLQAQSTGFSKYNLHHEPEQKQRVITVHIGSNADYDDDITARAIAAGVKASIDGS